jgi:hypothetical protein
MMVASQKAKSFRMLITQEQEIAGVPAVILRAFLKRNHGDDFDVKYAARELGFTQKKTRKLLDDLVDLGYLKKNEHNDYQPTLQGGALSLAKLGKGYSRKAAEKALEGFLQRVAKLNEDGQYAFRVNSVVLIGSMLTDKNPVGDVDLIVDLQPRLSDKDKQHELSQSRIRKARAAGRQLSGMMYYAWPTIEVFHFLKSRSPILSLHEPDQLAVLEPKEFKVLLDPREKSMSAEWIEHSR